VKLNWTLECQARECVTTSGRNPKYLSLRRAKLK
jgi:hypothetical protein